MSADSLTSVRALASRYTAAWCSHSPAAVAAFFSPSGSLTINSGTPAVGRDAITQAAQGFMTDFPDLMVYMDDVAPRGERYHYHWTLAGKNTGPGGTGRSVRISGYEDWRIGRDGLIAESFGHFDGAEYERQLKHGGMTEEVTREQVIQVVEQYINAVRHNNPSAIPLHPEVVCQFPTNTYRGAAAFQKGLEDFVRILKSIEVIRLVVDGGHCVAILNIDTVFGPIPFAEHLHVANGQIVSIRGYCDPRPMLDGLKART